MSLCRFLPTPSDRMGIIWSLLSIKDSVVLEYGPAGTTHYSMGLYGALNLELHQRLFTTHMSEDDVIMGDVSRLEKAIKEVDSFYQPKVIFVVGSSIAAVIGTDLKGVCAYMQEEVTARLIALEQGGFRGDYSFGLTEAYKLLVNTLTAPPTTAPTPSFNIIGASLGSFRADSDVWELQNLMAEAFGYELNTCLCCNTSVAAIGNMVNAQINLVLRSEGLAAAQSLAKQYGQPYLLSAPYGYSATLKWLLAVGQLIGKEPAPELCARLRAKIRQPGFAPPMFFRKSRLQAYIYGDYDLVKGVGDFLAENGITPLYQISKHSLKAIPHADAQVKFLPSEKEQMDILQGLHKTLILGNDITCLLMPQDNLFLRISSPLLAGSSTATHLPFIGEKGADYLMEQINLYLQKWG